MPKTKDKFTTVTQPGSATVIRKGSERGKRFAQDLEQTNQFLSTDPTPSSPALRRKVARNIAADWAGSEAKVDAKLSKEGNFSKRKPYGPVTSGDTRNQYAKYSK